MSLKADPEDGRIEAFDTGGETAAVVMLGSPRIFRTASRSEDGSRIPSLSIKANEIVVWVRRDKVLRMANVGGAGGVGTPVEREGKQGVRLGTEQSVVPDELREIYAEGAVELIFDDVVFRCERLYLDPHRYVALLVKPEFDGYAAGKIVGASRVPIFVRANTARLVGRGLTVFEDVEVSTSRADDRILLRGEVLTVEEFERGERPANPSEPHLLGYRRSSTQEYTLRRIRLQGERVPLFYWPYLAFGLSTEGEAFTSVLRGIDVGRRGNLGNYGFVQLGGDLNRTEDRSLTWEADVGGYTERGPAAGGQLTWDSFEAPSGLRTRGLVEAFGVYDGDPVDRNGLEFSEGLRGRVHTESRTRLTDDLHLDVEFSHFSDRGFNFEFFERDELTHKDYESYVRLYHTPSYLPGVVGTLTGKWHQRDFVTETILAPQAAVWLTGVPLVVPVRRGGFAVDVTSHSDVGYLGRRFDHRMPLVDYGNWRLSSETRVNFGLDVGDARLSGWLGGVADHYGDRDDGGADLTRTAALAGLRANLQLSRLYAAQGGLLRLHGLRHVVDLDLEFASRLADSHARDEVPFYDLRETKEEHSRVTLRARKRLQTRIPADPGQAPDPLTGYVPSGAIRNVLDWELSIHGYVNEQGPYGRDSPGAVESTVRAALTQDFQVISELDVDFRRGTQSGALGFGYGFGPAIGRVELGAGVRYVRDESLSLRGDVNYRFSDKYALRAQGAYDFRDAISTLRCVLRRHSEDHIWELGFRVRDGDFGVEFGLEPAIGGQTTRPARVFDDEPTLNPRGLFRE